MTAALSKAMEYAIDWQFLLSANNDMRSKAFQSIQNFDCQRDEQNVLLSTAIFALSILSIFSSFNCIARLHW